MPVAYYNNVAEVGNEQRTGKQIHEELYLLPAQNFNSSLGFPARVAGTYGNIPLKAGGFWFKIDTVFQTPELKNKGEAKEGGSTNIDNELTFSVGGVSAEVRELIEKGLGSKFYVAFTRCGFSGMFLLGNSCRPVELSNFEGGLEKDSTGYKLTFKNSCLEVFSNYSGTCPIETPRTIAANTTDIVITKKYEVVQLTTGVASASVIGSFDVSLLSEGDVFTIKGSGGTYPSTIAADTDIVLKNDVTWTAGSNAEITFQVFGTTIPKIIEVNRI